MFHQQKLIDQKSPLCLQLLCGNSTFTDNLVPVGKHTDSAWQHKGYGQILLKEAERLAGEEFGLKKLLVISALGTRRYYMRFGYERDGVYVSKRLN